MPFTPHPFARFIAILGRGRNLSRALTVEEAEEAMAMILKGDVLPEQLGAFLMLLRMKEEGPAELAGFVSAVRKTLPAPEPGLVDVDWSSYAGKKRQLPWFLLAALCLAQAGHKVFMHGFDGHTAGRLYTGEVLAALGLPTAPDFAAATRQLKQNGFAYMDLAAISPPLARMMGFKPILGLRSPVHTLARMINPFGAPCLLQGIFHPNYMATHRDAALLLGEQNMVVFRGEGGEIERRPGKPCETLGVAQRRRRRGALAAADGGAAPIARRSRWRSRACWRSGAARPRIPMPKPRSPARWRSPCARWGLRRTSRRRKAARKSSGAAAIPAACSRPDAHFLRTLA